LPFFVIERAVPEKNRPSFSKLLCPEQDFSVLILSVSRRFGQTMKSCKNLTCSLFNANFLKSAKDFIYRIERTTAKTRCLYNRGVSNAGQDLPERLIK